MSKGDTFEEQILKNIFCNSSVSSVGDAGGLQGSSVAGNLWVALHTADVGEAGTQSTNEITYTSYNRTSVARGSAGWTVTNNSVSPASAITFPAGTGGSGTATHFSVGVLSTGAGKVLYYGTVSPNIVCGDGVTPQLTTSTAVTES